MSKKIISGVSTAIVTGAIGFSISRPRRIFDVPIAKENFGAIGFITILFLIGFIWGWRKPELGLAGLILGAFGKSDTRF